MPIIKTTLSFLIIITLCMLPYQSIADKSNFENKESFRLKDTILHSVVDNVYNRIKCVDKASYSPRSPIYIIGNDDFTKENGVIAGDGTRENPYIIEDWEIEGTFFWKIVNKFLSFLEQTSLEDRLIFFVNIPVCGIFLKDTNKHVVIRNNFIHEWKGCNRDLLQVAGITLINNSNVTFERCLFKNNYRGINIQNVNMVKKIIENSTHIFPQSFNCTNITIKFNNFVANEHSAVYICKVYNSTIMYNDITDNGCGVQCDVSKIIISHNNIFSNGNGILCTQHDYSTIEHNVIMDNGNGIYCAESYPLDYIGSNPTIAHNIITENAAGIFITTNYPNISNNTISHNLYGIMNMGWSKLPVRIIDNVISNNSWYGINYYGPCIIEHNLISSNDEGMSVSGNASIQHNIILSNKANGILCGPLSYKKRPCIHNNNIFNNAGKGVWYIETIYNVTIDATYNYWGSPDGPSGYGPGTGDEVDVKIIYEPWLIESNSAAGPR